MSWKVCCLEKKGAQNTIIDKYLLFCRNIIPQIEIALTIISGVMIIVGCVLFWKSNSCRLRSSSIQAVSVSPAEHDEFSLPMELK